MLSAIRDRLKTWVIGLLITLVAIPLVFLGVGDYGSNHEQYAFSVNDQDISKSIIQQEMSQFKEVLRKNYQGNIPPIYTDNFIKKITFDNLIRRNVENSISSNIGLVTSDESIINEIQETSSFRDENGFNPSLYKKRLFLINMNPDVYEQYLYQKGIREQLRKTITDSSILTLTDKKLNINANYHKRDGKILFLKLKDMKDTINITLDDINDYYIKNKEAFLSSSSAEFSYIRLSKESIISSIEVSDSELLEDYQKKINSGSLSLDKTYTLNHLVFPIKDNKESVLANANEALNELLSNKSFEYISKKYEVDEDTKNNLGFIGKLSFDDLPNFIKNNLTSMEAGDIKLVSSESNAIHIIKLIESSPPGNKKFADVREDIKTQIQKNNGSKKYFSMLDSIKEKIYIQNLSFEEISKSYDLTLLSTKKIGQDYSDNILSRRVINQLFNDIDSTDIYPPMYISNDDILFVKKNKYYPPSQLTLSESEQAIKALLMTQKSNKKLNQLSSKKLQSLNAGTDNDYKSFSVYQYDKTFDDEVMKIINNQSISNTFTSSKLESGDYVFIKVESINLSSVKQDKVDDDNYLDYLRNTQSESDYNSFYLSKYDTFEIDINNDYLNQ